MKPIILTGVITRNHVDWLEDDLFTSKDVNLTYEDHCVECKGDKESGHEFCWEDDGGDVRLIGFKRVDRRRVNDAWFSVGDLLNKTWKGWLPDPKAEYSAVVREDVVQVVLSGYAVKGRMCSPCYPNQVDVDSLDDENGYWGYSLPPDMFDKEYNDYPVDKIVKVEDIKE